MRRASLHVEPIGATETARHYIRDLVYGAHDGLITTFAVVSGVAGGSIAVVAVVVVGALKCRNRGGHDQHLAKPPSRSN